MLAYKLLPILADGRFYSGTELGERLNISRAAIWKGMQNLKDLGVGFDSVRGKGYRLHSPLVLLDSQTVAGSLNEDVACRVYSIETHFRIDSTNSELLRQFSQHQLQLDEHQVSVCLAESQAMGRGRRGREWLSPFGCNLYLSLARQFSNGLSCLEGMSLVTGLAVVRALESIGLAGVTVKWPNDILLDGKKLAGILLEMSSGAMGEYRIVTGVGINVSPSPETMQVLEQPWTALSQHLPVAPERNLLASRVTEAIINVVDELQASGFDHFREEWDSIDAVRGRQVSLRLSDDSVISGQAMGVNNEGGLILNTSEGERVFNGGEISLKLSEQFREGY